MSVYLFGKLFVNPVQITDTQRRMSSLAEEVEAGISFDSLDEDDQLAIDYLPARNRVLLSLSHRVREQETPRGSGPRRSNSPSR
jgi:hypothetical protein